MSLEPAKVLEWKECSGCALGAACLADGPIPDAEAVGIAGIAGLFLSQILLAPDCLVCPSNSGRARPILLSLLTVKV